MNREWLGIADDLTEDGVIGKPYKAPTPATSPRPSEYPNPPSHGRFKALLFLGAVGIGMLTEPGQHLWDWIETGFLGEGKQTAPLDAPAITTRDARSEPSQIPPETDNVTSPLQSDVVQQGIVVGVRKKKAPRRPKTPLSASEPSAESAEEATLSKKSQGVSEDTDIDLDKYRTLTRGL